MLTECRPGDPAFAELVDSAHRRFRHLVAEAEVSARPFYERTLGRAASIPEVIDEVFAAVEREGDVAVARYGKAFDGADLPAQALRIDPGACAAAHAALPPALADAMATAIAQVTEYQKRLLPADSGTDLRRPLGVRWTPLDRVGAYVPGGAGGSLPLFSSVIMNLVPAKVAGVPQTVLCTPSRPDGSVATEVLAAAHAVGVDAVYRIGGIPAIAAMAIGTASLPQVDKIVGPGNIVVTLAKQRAFGRVDIDMLAGPSEVLVLADDSAHPAFVAADLLSQAEHDPLAMAICIAIGPGVASAVQRELAVQLDNLPGDRRETARQSVLRFGRLIRTQTLSQALDAANRIAAEHVELQVRDPRAALAGLRHAGAVFIGPWSPEPIGDYVAGPSHTLPTGGTARMWSGIGADTFLKRTSIISFTEADFRRLAAAGTTLAEAEGLTAHARSIAIRLAPPPVVRPMTIPGGVRRPV
jgi:histidinol dehydrogenase